MTEQIKDEQKIPKKSRSRWANVGILFSTIAVIILIGAASYAYVELSKVNINLAQEMEDLAQQNARQKQDIATLKTSLNDLQQITQKAQSLTSQQEQFMAEWRSAQKGDLNKWRIAEAQYLVKLANDHLRFSSNTQLAMILIQEADKELANTQDDNVNEIRKSLATDLLSLQAAPKIDITSLYMRLSAVNNQIDKLPLPANPLKAEEKVNQPVVSTNDLPWWKAGLVHSWDALRKIVIVRNIGSNALPLVMPDEKIFIYQNLHAQMEDAMWGLLHSHGEIYKTSLERAASWTKQYFVQEAPETKTLLQEMESLQNEIIQPAAMNLTNSLQLFDKLNVEKKQ